MSTWAMRIAREHGLDGVGDLNTVEEAAVRFGAESDFWWKIAKQVHEKVCEYVGEHVGEVRVRLFSMAGRLLNSE